MRGSLAAAADLMVTAEPVWVLPALAFTCTSLLWGQSYSWIGLAIAFSVFPLRRWRLGYLSRRTPLEFMAALLLAASLVGLAVSPDRGLSLRPFQSVVAGILLYYSLVNVRHPPLVKWGFAFAALCVFAVALLAFRDGFTPPPGLGGFGTWVHEQLRHLPQVPRPSRIANPTLSATHGLTIVLELVLIPLIGVALFSRRRSDWIPASLMGLPFLLLLLLFGSQGAWLAVFVGSCLLLVWRTRWAALPLAAAVGLGCLGYCQGWLDPSPLLTRFNPAESLSGRVHLWEAALNVIRDHPVAGCGLGCLGNYSTTTYLSPHNAYLQFYADFGIIGTFALLGALIVGGRMAVDLVKTPRRDPGYGFAVGILGAAVAVGVHGIFEGSPAGIIAETADGYSYIVSPIFAILAGLLVGTRRIMEESTPQTPASVSPRSRD